MMQARRGSHGDYEIIAVSPNSPQECFDLTIKAFNLAEQCRVPVLVMMDECVGHMMERVVIPRPEEIEIYPRRWTNAPLDEYLPFAPGEDLVPPMARAGQGYRFHMTGLKLAAPDMKVVVYSGDGDLFAIGGNHFIRSRKRRTSSSRRRGSPRRTEGRSFSISSPSDSSAPSAGSSQSRRWKRPCGSRFRRGRST